MAPYAPPNAHYSQVDVSSYDEDTMFHFVGKSGKRFYWLTTFLDLDYVWYDNKRKVIELWGPFSSLAHFQAHHVINCELEHLSHQRNAHKIKKHDSPHHTPIAGGV